MRTSSWRLLAGLFSLAAQLTARDAGWATTSAQPIKV
jgi:hypothetical protein